MDLPLECPQCHSIFPLAPPHALRGSTVSCPRCQTSFKLNGPVLADLFWSSNQLNPSA